MNQLKISLVQSTIFWEDKPRNILHYGRLLQSLKGKTDLVLLPELFTTGFSMTGQHLAEPNEGPTVATLRQWAAEYRFALCGSFLATENGRLYNRGFFITPQGSEDFYDKRHLFRMGGEDKHFAPGQHPLIVAYRGWNIRLIVCYDLRFPVWSRNLRNGYDLLICPANWPAARRNAWEILLKARALENQAYVCGLNRIGDDANRIPHRGDSLLIDFKGETLAACPPDRESILTATIEKEPLEQFRTKFPAWKDADGFNYE